MTTPRRKCDDDVTEMSSPERIHRDGRQVAGASSATQAVVNPSNAPQLLEAALREVATPALRARGEDPFDAIAYQPVSKERAA